MPQRKQVEVSDEVLLYLAERLREKLLRGKPAEVRSVVRQTLLRVEVKNYELGLHYVPPLVAREPIAWINSVHSWELEGAISHLEFRVNAINPLPSLQT